MMIKAINYLERLILMLIVILTIGAIGFEIYDVYLRRDIILADLLLLFIYAEVIAMVSVFLRSEEVPVLYPIFIAITALARLIILQGKEMAPENILYEAISIFVLSLAIILLRSRQARRLIDKMDHEYDTKPEKNSIFDKDK